MAEFGRRPTKFTTNTGILAAGRTLGYTAAVERKQSRTLMYVVIGVAIFFLIDPFNIISPQDNVAIGRRTDSETVNTLTELYDQIAQPIDQYLVRLADNHDAVFLGYFPRIREPIVNLTAAVPTLYDAGHRAVGVDWFLSRDQEMLDRIVTAPSFNADDVHRLLFNNVVVSGYQEYVDLVEAAWQVNNDAPEGAEPFRIIGLSVFINYELVQTEEDAEDPEVLAQLFPRGAPDNHMAQIILDDFVGQGQTIIALLPLQHTLARYEDTAYAESAGEAGIDDARRAARIVYGEIGGRVTNAMFHNPIQSTESMTGTDYPTAGAIDALVFSKDGVEQFQGFNVVGNAFGALTLPPTPYVPEGSEEELVLEDLADGYIVTGPISQLDAVTAIPGFITEENVEEAMRRFPGPKEEDLSPQDLNEFQAGMSQQLDRMIDSFQ